MLWKRKNKEKRRLKTKTVKLNKAVDRVTNRTNIGGIERHRDSNVK